MLTNYDLDKIKFATDGPTFERAVNLYEGKKVTKFQEVMGGYSSVVLGGQPYRVYVSARHYDRGDCECYLGQNDRLCKHMVAVAIYAVMMGEPLQEEDKESVDKSPECSGRLGELNKEELSATKKIITSAMRYIKPYIGPSRIWFAYQDSLSEGVRRLSVIVSDLPVSEQTAKLLVDLLLRLDKKVCGGVDDSDGTIGGFIYEIVEVLKEYVELDPRCIKTFEKLCDQHTCFEWEKQLVRMVDEQDID